MIGRPPGSPLFPYTTLFRSASMALAAAEVVAAANGAPVRDLPGEVLDWLAEHAGALPGDLAPLARRAVEDRKSTRLNSSHANISYAVFCLKKKNIRSTDPAD